MTQTKSKPRVLVVSDHSSLHTGFANVSRHILNHLCDSGKYEIAELGWFAPRIEDVRDRLPRWRVYVTDTSNPMMAERDKYGSITMGSAVADFRPDLVLTIGDQWMVSHVTKMRDEFGFTWVGYVPIDGLPHPPEWSETFNAMDVCVAYGRWGAHVMQMRSPNLKPLHIFHGVESDVFKPDALGRAEVRKAMGLDEEHFLVGSVGRNQPRKQFPLLMKAFAMWSKPHCICTDTGKPFLVKLEDFYINELVHPFTSMPYLNEARENARLQDSGTIMDGWHVSPFTGKSVDLESRIWHPRARLYIHCALDDVGWNLYEQAGRYRIQDKVILRDSLQVALGVSDADLAKIYSAFDVFALPTIGEGFGLPILEAMSCGVPLAVTDYSGHTEWCREAGEMVKPITFFTEPITSIERALCDPSDFVACLERLHGSKELRKRYSANGRFMAVRMDWKKAILPQWERIVDQALTIKRPAQESKPKTNTVEVC